MKRFRDSLSVLIVAILIITLPGCSLGKQQNKGTIKVSKSEMYFGTVMSITLYGDDENKLSSIIEKAYNEIDRLERIFSAKREDSELYRLNSTAIGKDVTVSDELFEVLERALYYNELSKGALDVSIGKIVDLWGIGTDYAAIPDASELEHLKDINGCRYISLNPDKKTVTITDERVKIDLGAIAKGYAGDRIKELIINEDRNCTGFLNFGGNLVAIGSKNNGENWTFAITNPRETSQYSVLMAVNDKCIVTSGDYERYFEYEGERYHHILDASTGFPSKSGIISASIIGPSSMECDALSTGCFILGVEKALELIEKLPEYEAYFITEDGGVYISQGAGEYIIDE